MEKLKPCPFCGAKNPIFVRHARRQSVYGQPIYGTRIGCRCCEATMFYRSEKLAIEAWNKRAELQWIPCNERLPEKPNVYTVTDSKGDVVRFVFDNTESSREYWLRCAKAWMPVPEPYREEGGQV